MKQPSDALLWSLVKRFTKSNGLNTSDDYMSEARAAAVLAIRKYDKLKNSSLDAYVVKCVKNRLIDLRREDRHEQECSDELPDVVVNCESDMHFSLTMKQLLTPFEYRVYYDHFVEDRSVTEIAKRLEIHKRKVSACLSMVILKYSRIEDSYLMISSRRRLQEKWLDLERT